MTEDKHRPLEIIENLKFPPEKEPPQRGKDCPACGARLSKQAGLTHCAFCGHEFSAGPGNGEQDKKT